MDPQTLPANPPLGSEPNAVPPVPNDSVGEAMAAGPARPIQPVPLPPVGAQPRQASLPVDAPLPTSPLNPPPTTAPVIPPTLHTPPTERPPLAQPPEHPPVAAKPAKPPRSPLVFVLGGLIGLGLLLGLGYWIWGMIGPQTSSALPTPSPAPTIPARPTTTPNPSDASSSGQMVACTMEAKICPDGSSVGRSGPNCEFAACPGEDTTKGGQTVPGNTGSGVLNTPSPTGGDQATWDTYKNPTYALSFRFPPTWEVRTLTAPRNDVKFKHGFGPRANFTAQGYVEASTLPEAELIEQVKLAEGGTATTQPNRTLGTLPVTVIRVTKGSASTDHWFVRANDFTYHLVGAGAVPEVAQIAQTYKID